MPYVYTTCPACGGAAVARLVEPGRWVAACVAGRRCWWVGDTRP